MLFCSYKTASSKRFSGMLTLVREHSLILSNAAFLRELLDLALNYWVTISVNL